MTGSPSAPIAMELWIPLFGCGKLVSVVAVAVVHEQRGKQRSARGPSFGDPPPSRAGVLRRGVFYYKGSAVTDIITTGLVLSDDGRARRLDS